MHDDYLQAMLAMQQAQWSQTHANEQARYYQMLGLGGQLGSAPIPQPIDKKPEPNKLLLLLEDYNAA